MEALKKRFEFDAIVSGQNPMDYMASLLEKNEKQEIEIERGKLSVSILKQMHNRNRLLVDAAKYELKEMESKLKMRGAEFVEA
jgi:hypothetical protein